MTVSGSRPNDRNRAVFHDSADQSGAAAWDQAQVTDASLLVVLCANLKAWEQDPAKYWRNAPKPVQDFLVPAIDQYYQGYL